jgi:hypothetical protein
MLLPFTRFVQWAWREKLAALLASSFIGMTPDTAMLLPVSCILTRIDPAAAASVLSTVGIMLG